LTSACLNRHGPRAFDSLFRYALWAPRASGPRDAAHNTQGVLALDETVECTRAVASLTEADAPLVAQARRYEQALRALEAVLDKAHAYYAWDRFQQDDGAEGRALHPQLWQSYDAFAAAYGELRGVVVARNQAGEAALRARLEHARAEHALKLHAIGVAQRALFLLIDKSPSELEAVNPGDFDERFAALATSVDRLVQALGSGAVVPAARPESKRIADAARELSRETSKTRRLLGPNAKRSELRKLANAQYMLRLEGAPGSLQQPFRTLVDALNTSAPLKRYTLVEVRPVWTGVRGAFEH
jgi:hypothetical protein